MCNVDKLYTNMINAAVTVTILRYRKDGLKKTVLAL